MGTYLKNIYFPIAIKESVLTHYLLTLYTIFVYESRRLVNKNRFVGYEKQVCQVRKRISSPMGQIKSAVPPHGQIQQTSFLYPTVYKYSMY